MTKIVLKPLLTMEHAIRYVTLSNVLVMMEPAHFVLLDVIKIILMMDIAIKLVLTPIVITTEMTVYAQMRITIILIIVYALLDAPMLCNQTPVLAIQNAIIRHVIGKMVNVDFVILIAFKIC